MSNPSPLPDPIGEIQAAYGEPWHREGGFGGPYVCGRVGRPNGEGLFQTALQGVGIEKLRTSLNDMVDRAIQCVNALAGITDPAAHLSTLAATVERLEAERDSLRKRVETLHNAVREREDAFAASERAHERTKRQHVVVSCDGRRADHLMPDGVIIATKIVDMREYLRMVDPARLPFMLAQTITAELDEYARSAAALAARTGRAGT